MKNILLCATLVLALVAPAIAAQEQAPARLELVDHIGKDPMIAVVIRTENLLEPIQKILDTVARLDAEFKPEAAEQAFVELETELGFPLRDELLAQLGPEFGFVLNLPPMDSIMAAAQGFPASLPSIMGGTGFMARVRDATMVDRSLKKLLLFDEEGEIIEGDDGLVRVRYAASSQAGDGEDKGAMELCYGIRNGRLAIGLNPDWVLAALEQATSGKRLADGEDFQQVFANLDADPFILGYVNLPLIRTWIDESEMLQMMTASDPEAAIMLNLFLSEDLMGVGLGHTSVEMNGGVRASAFGPAGLTGAGMYTGIVAAIAIPNLLNAIDRGKQKRTMADIRSIGTVMESYAIDNNLYPVTEGWQPVGVLGESVEPVYIRKLPVADGWDNGILVLSDGENYTIVSYGKDGVPDQDWSGEIQGDATTTFNGDIVFRNGQFVAWPEGIQQ